MFGNQMDLTQVDTIKYRNSQMSHPLKLRFSSFNWQMIKDLIALITLFIFAIVAVYFMPQSLSNILFLGFVIFFWFSRKDYFWFAYFFLLVEQPGYFFVGFSSTALYSLPEYTFMPGMSVTLIDLFVISALIKAILKGKKTKLELEKPLILILAYVLFVVCLSIINGATLAFLSNILRGPFYYTIIISFLYLIKNRNEAYSFIILITTFVFFVIFTQLFFLVTKTEFINLFYHNFMETNLFRGSDILRAMPGGFLILFFSFIFSLFLIEDKTNRISKKYLFLIVGAVYLSSIISGTRVWFVVLSFVIIGYLFLSQKKISKLIQFVSVLVLVTVILVLSGIISSDIARATMSRLGEIQFVVTGDFISATTFHHRYSFRLPRVLIGVKKFLIVGSGFTENYYQYRDPHVGFFNTILQFGIVGFSFFLYFIWCYFYSINKTLKKLSLENSLRNSLRFLAVVFGGIIFANFWTHYFFYMDYETSHPFFIAVYIGLTEVFIREAKREELQFSSN